MLAPRTTAVLGLALLVALGQGCRGERNQVKPPPPSTSAATPEETSVILLSLDTLRADHVGAYGYPRPTTPNLDALAQDSVLFESTIAQAPSTLPSHASLFTSLIVSHHGALFSRRQPLRESATTMAEILQAAGYVTVGFHDGGQMDGYLGLGQGFDTYEIVPQPAVGSEFWRTVARTVPFLDERSSGRFFLFLHTYGVHHPYCAESVFVDMFVNDYRGPLPRCLTKDILAAVNDKKIPINQDDARHITDMYDAGVRSVDTSLGRLVADLKQRGLYESSLIVVTSDHGEELGERGQYGWHSHALYDEQIKVPLIIKLPRSELRGTRVTAQVRSIDILPTMLEVLGIAGPQGLEGRSALGLAQGNVEEPRLAVSQRDATDAILPAIARQLEWKYEHRSQERRELLFDLRVDAQEETNIIQTDEDIATRLRDALHTVVRGRAEPIPVTPAAPDLPEQLKRQLRSLGYLSESLKD